MRVADAPGPLARGLRAAGRFLLRVPVPLAGALVAGWAGLIWWLSAHRVPTPARETFLGEMVSNLAHAPLFGLLGLWIATLVLRRELKGGRQWPVVERGSVGVVLGLVGTWGVIDEWHQSRVPGRDASGLDVVTDVVGAAMVLWVVAALGEGTGDRVLWRRLGGATMACVASALLATVA